MTMKWLRIGLMSRLVVDLLYITLHSSSARVATLTLRSVSRACLRSASPAWRGRRRAVTYMAPVSKCDTLYHLCDFQIVHTSDSNHPLLRFPCHKHLLDGL